ncbi:MAG TPA: hypothetical protein VFX85_11095 [Solirubrobacterales bacterium]|nr:hypothetical protein [Solirubrobacterales bacterium]
MLLTAAIGALALTALLGASSASASGIAFAQYPATVGGKEISTHSFILSGERIITCDFSALSAFATGPSETLQVTATPSSCSSKYESGITLKMNGCKFIYHPAPGKGSLDIGPAGCGPITLEGANCTRTFSSQIGGAASFENLAKTVRVIDEASLQYKRTKGTLAACGSETGPATFSGSWVINGLGPEGAQVKAEAIAGTGLYMTGQQSEEAAKQPKFAAEKYPVTITGFQDPAQKQALTITGNRKVECGEANSLSQASAATAQLTLNTEYVGCVLTVLLNEFTTVISTNGCSFQLNALNAGPPYKGSVDIACGEGKAIELNVYGGGAVICTYKISPQSGLTGVGLTNVGTGTEQGVAVSYNLSGIPVTRVKGTLAACGYANQTATYTGATTLHGIS